MTTPTTTKESRPPRWSGPWPTPAIVAGGGVWRTRDATAGNLAPQWVPRTDQLPSTAVGAVAFAPGDGTGSWSFHEQPRTGDTVLPTSDDAAAAEPVPLAAQLPHVGTGDINGWTTIRTAGSAQVPTHRQIPNQGGRWPVPG